MKEERGSLMTQRKADDMVIPRNGIVGAFIRIAKELGVPVMFASVCVAGMWVVYSDQKEERRLINVEREKDDENRIKLINSLVTNTESLQQFVQDESKKRSGIEDLVKVNAGKIEEQQKQTVKVIGLIEDARDMMTPAVPLRQESVRLQKEVLAEQKRTYDKQEEAVVLLKEMLKRDGT